jgi:hypothetical protein
MSGNTEMESHLRQTTTFFDGTFSAENVTVVICCALALYNAFLLLMYVTMR